MTHTNGEKLGKTSMNLKGIDIVDSKKHFTMNNVVCNLKWGWKIST
jgi:hypothetical protein